MSNDLDKKVILLTGSTGVVGSAFLYEVILKSEHELYLPIRAKKNKSPKDRIISILKFYDSKLSLEQLINRVHIFDADLTLPRMGKSEEFYQELINKITHIVHSAASVELHTSITDALKNSLAPTNEILKFQKLVQQKRNCPMEYVSTVGVLGKSNNILVEKKVDFTRSYHNAYEEAKSVAEEQIFKAIKEENLPIVIHRPSMIIGDSINGRIIHEQIFYFILKFISGKFTFGLFPSVGTLHLDTIPIDKVAQIIFASMNNTLPKGTILHHCSGPKISIEVSYLQQLLRDNSLLNIYVPLRFVKFYFNLLHFLAVLTRNKSNLKKAKVLKNILEYSLNDSKFSNELTKKVIAIWGINIPSPKEYISKVIREYNCS